jgi:hypothetical protein
MTNLNAVTLGMNKYCGPAVLSILTGRDTDECARVISSINGQYQVAGVQLDHLIKAANKLGFDSKLIGVSGTLYRTLVSIANDDGQYIVTVPNHFIVIEVNNKEIFFCDNHTKEPIRAASSARLMQACIACYKVEKRKNFIEPVKLAKISEEVKVKVIGPMIVVTREHKYNIPERNKSESIGNLYFLDKDELNNFVEKLDALLGENND